MRREGDICPVCNNQEIRLKKFEDKLMCGQCHYQEHIKKGDKDGR